MIHLTALERAQGLIRTAKTIDDNWRNLPLDHPAAPMLFRSARKLRAQALDMVSPKDQVHP
jgi:hypothetical protein